MTRNEFLENVTTWEDLNAFCYNEECDICEDVYDEVSRDEYIDSCLMDWACNDNWQDLYNRLSNIPTGYDYYRDNGYGDWSCLDDEDFDAYKRDVLEWGSYNGVWDAEEEDEDFGNEPFREKAYDEPAPEEDFSVRDLMNMCGCELVAIQKADEQRRKEDDDDMIRLFAV